MRVSTIAHATEDLSKVTQAVSNISQTGGSSEPAVSRAKGHHGNQITTLVWIVKNPRVAEGCLRVVWKRLTVIDRDTVLSRLASRVDNSGILFLRIDKQEAFKGTMRLQESDPIKVEISFKTSPSKQDAIVGDIQNFLTNISTDV